MREQVLLIGAQAADEVEAQVGILVERILALGRNLAVHDDRRQRARRQAAVGEEQVAVAALEARLVLDRNLVARKAAARFVGEHVVQARAHLAGMGAAAHGLAVRREDEGLDALEVGAVDRLGETVVQTLDGQRRRDLADEAAGVGEAGLQRQPLPALHVVDVGLLFQQALDDAGAGLEAERRFEQRRHVGDVVDAEQRGEEDGDQHRRRRFRLGDEEADRRLAVDVLLDLRDQRELADGRRRLQVERLEVHRLVARRLDHADDARQRLAFRQVARPRLVHEGAERVVELHGVDAHVDVRGAEARRLHQPGEHRDAALALAIGERSISDRNSETIGSIVVML